MGYWYKSTGDFIDSSKNFMVFMTEDGSNPLKKPDSEILTLRLGPNYGSGPYYKCCRDPYLENDSYSAAGKVYVGTSVTWKTKTDWRGYYGLGREFVSNTNAYQFRALRSTIRGNSGGGAVQALQIVRTSAGYYACESNVQWTQSDGAKSISTGCFGCLVRDREDILEAARWVVSFVGENPDLFLTPYLAGSINKRYWTVNSKASANVSYWTSVRKLNKNYASDYQSGNIHVTWKFDEFVDRRAEWLSVADLGVIPGRIRNAASLALADAMAGLPEVSANSVMNVLEISSGISNAFKVGSRGISGILRSLRKGLRRGADPRNAWLSWRYVYNTTKMDLADYRDVTNRLLNITQYPTFKVHGTGNGDGFRIRCVRQYLTKDFNVLDYDTKRLLKTYGFKLSAYNIWDMVPYSFMVDWFTHVGPKIELAESWNRQYDFTSTDVWYSYYEQLQHGFIYYRWHNTDPSVPPTYVQHETSKRTLTYRLADTVSIFT